MKNIFISRKIEYQESFNRCRCWGKKDLGKERLNLGEETEGGG